MRFDHNLIKKDNLSVTLDFRLLHICRCSSSHTTVVLLNFITLVIQDVRSILVTRFAVDIDQPFQASLAIFGHLLLLCYWHVWFHVRQCYLIFCSIFGFFLRTYLSETLELSRLISEKILGNLRRRSPGLLPIDFVRIGGGHQQARTWHDCILIQFGNMMYLSQQMALQQMSTSILLSFMAFPALPPTTYSITRKPLSRW